VDEGPGYWGRGGTASAMAIVTSTLMNDHEIYVPPKLVGDHSKPELVHWWTTVN